jgi:hypothetical protein
VKVVLLAILLLSGFVSSAEDQPVVQSPSVAVTRKAGETDKAFVERVTKHELINEPSDQLAVTSQLVKGKEVIVAFTGEEIGKKMGPEGPSHDIDINFFTKIKKDEYTLASVVACEIEGRPATLRSFFFINIDKKSELSVGVICGWDAPHNYADCQLNDMVKFFKPLADSKWGEINDPQFNKAFYFKKKEKGSDFSCTFSKFKNAGDVKKIVAKFLK